MTTQISIDKALAIRVGRGDEAAFEKFFSEYFPRLFRFVLSRTDGDEAVAEEVVQRTLCNVMYRMDSYRGDAPLFTWLCSICRNELSAYFRKSGREDSFAQPVEDNTEIHAALERVSEGDDDPLTERHRDEIARYVQATLGELPGNYARVLEWKYMQGHSVAQIAGELGLSEKAAESVLTRARKAFRDGFERRWGFAPRLFADN
ncbi:RNA polymerase sigma factor [Lentisalinibacter sediminis]|uniref:RNA polymerase sigma factor n=1 Tax=Lentisalinibacter sediminis TaxID=2992237 RepID=UPI00386CBC43